MKLLYCLFLFSSLSNLVIAISTGNLVYLALSVGFSVAAMVERARARLEALECRRKVLAGEWPRTYGGAANG